MEKILHFYLSAHATRRVDERGLSVEALKAVVKYHQRRTQQRRGEHGGFVYLFEKTVDGRTLKVVAEIKKSECWIATGYYEAT